MLVRMQASAWRFGTLFVHIFNVRCLRKPEPKKAGLEETMIAIRDAVCRRMAFTAVFMLIAANLPAQGAASGEQKPVVSDKPLTAEQLAIYHEVLKGWMDDGKQAVHLAIETVPLEEDAKSCIKGVRLEEIDGTTIHRFRQEDLPQLGSAKISLVDPDAQAREIEKNDPDTAICNGKSVDEAVQNGFAHGLVTLSEIRFDQRHELAIVWYGFRWGGSAVMELRSFSKRRMVPGN
jgi:hypothetical protein